LLDASDLIGEMPGVKYRRGFLEMVEIDFAG
jgi:hypothetical protein